MIRPYTSADINGLLTVWYRASQQAHPFLSPEFLRAERIRIAEDWLPLSQTLVCVVDDRVVGFVSLVGNEIGGLFVDPEHQGRGLGTDLVDAACAIESFPELSVFEENYGARAFYEKLGFEVLDRRINEDNGLWELRMRLASDSPRTGS